MRAEHLRLSRHEKLVAEVGEAALGTVYVEEEGEAAVVVADDAGLGPARQPRASPAVLGAAAVVPRQAVARVVVGVVAVFAAHQRRRQRLQQYSDDAGHSG